MEKKPSVNAATRVRSIFNSSTTPLLLSQIQSQTGLNATEVSMALSYLMKRKELVREQITNPAGKGRKLLWLYTHSKESSNV